MSNTKRLQSLSERLINRELRCETFTRAALLELIDILLDMQEQLGVNEDLRVMLLTEQEAQTAGLILPRDQLDDTPCEAAKAPEAEPDTLAEIDPAPDATYGFDPAAPPPHALLHLPAGIVAETFGDAPPPAPPGLDIAEITVTPTPKPKRKPAKPRKRKAKK